MKFVIGLNRIKGLIGICNRIKVVLQIVLIIILQKSELIHIILALLKKIFTFDNVIILIKSVVNENKNKYYYNIFLENGSYKDKSDTQYF